MNDSKRQVLPSGLWVVATPIGNLGDLTPRAQMALEDADLILCEDTRRTSALLSSLDQVHFSKRLERLDAHTQLPRIQKWVDELCQGKSFALVTDAGTPSISDPGALLVAAASQAGVRITPLPGASAVVSLLSVSGFQETSFAFRGFFPRKGKEQKEELTLASTSNLASIVVWFESPLRILETLKWISKEVPDSKMVVGKELTKLHEKLFYGTAEEVEQHVRQEITTEGAIGEWCFGIEFKKIAVEEEKDLSWIKALQCLFEANISVSDSVKKVSQIFGVSKKEVYEAALRIWGKKMSGGG